MQDSYQILLGSVKSKESLVENNFLNIELNGKKALIEETDVQTLLDLDEQYVKERDTCTKYRLTITINPICTNVLCNPTSTIIERHKNRDELITNKRSGQLGGTKMTKYIYKPVISTKNKTVDYYMGYDIFDNIYFRTKSIRLGEFMDDTVKIQMDKEITEHAYLRDNINGYDQAIRDNLEENRGWIQCINPSRIMLWNENNGAYSLRDDSKICFVKGGNCEKTDLFPTREMLLFNTLFKYNDAGRLINEENWSYFLCYPYKNDYNHWLVRNKERTLHGIPIVFAKIIEAEDKNNPFNKPTLLIQTAYSNNFKVFNKIRVYYINNDGDNEHKDFVVQRILDDTRFYLTLNKSNKEVDDYDYPTLLKNSRVKKIVNGIPCDYYIKQFRKIPNWKFENEKITPENVEEKLQNNKQLFNNTKYNLAFGKNIFDDKMVQISFTDSVDINLLKDNMGRPVTKIFFTIFKNNEYKISWSDYVNITSKSNEFQPRSGDDNYKTDFQRYWSKNSVGYELVYPGDEHFYPVDKEETEGYPNIYCMHNLSVIDPNGRQEYPISRVIPPPINETPRPPLKILIPYEEEYRNTFTAADRGDFKWPYPPNSVENDIENETKTEFYGDICEFDKSNFRETVLSKCQYRFNTVNRESELLHDKCIITHGIALFNSDGISSADTFDLKNPPEPPRGRPPVPQYDPVTGQHTFDGEAFWGNISLPSDGCVSASQRNNKDDEGKIIWRELIQAGPRPEGYYYQSHYPITLKWYENELQYKSFRKIYFKTDDIYYNSYIGEYVFEKEHCLVEGQGIVEFLPFFTHNKHNLLQKTLLKIIWTHGAIEYEKAFVITTIRKDERKILVPHDDDLYNYIINGDINKNIDALEVYVYDYDTPLWARHIGFGQFVWRNIMSQDDAAINSLEEFPFTNGNLYVHKQINFFLRRQSIGCSDMTFTHFPADISTSTKHNINELYENINEIC